MWIDTHAHLNDEAFDATVAQVVERSENAGVAPILVVGIDAPSSQKAIELAERFESLYAVVGIQPNSLTEEKQEDWEIVQRLANHPKAIALGETGLDRYWKVADFERQIRYFQDHLQFAHERSLPVVIHCRESESDILECLTSFHQTTGKPISGVMHSFTGDVATAEKFLELGLYISFAGMVTYKKNDALRETAKSIPSDRILVETDSPYLAPHPLRGKTNEPAHVIHTGACIAEVRGVALEEFARQTTANARRLFQLY